MYSRLDIVLIIYPGRGGLIKFWCAPINPIEEETLLKTEGGDDEIDRWLETITRHVFTNFDKSVMIRARACCPRYFTCSTAVYGKVFLIAYTLFSINGSNESKSSI